MIGVWKVSTVNDLVEWLRAQLDDEERAALKPEARDWVHETTPDPSGPDHVLLIGERVVSAGFFEDDPLRPAEAAHIARHDPARVLRDVEAKRHLVEQADLRGRAIRTATLDGGFFDHILRVLALSYSDRPGYQEAWRP